MFSEQMSHLVFLQNSNKKTFHNMYYVYFYKIFFYESDLVTKVGSTPRKAQSSSSNQTFNDDVRSPDPN